MRHAAQVYLIFMLILSLLINLRSDMKGVQSREPGGPTGVVVSVAMFCIGIAALYFAGLLQ